MLTLLIIITILLVLVICIEEQIDVDRFLDDTDYKGNPHE